MGVYIKNIELPKHDDEYVIFTVYGDGGVVYGPLNRPHVRYKERAVPVPPHGRLIDADALMHEFEKAQRTMAQHGQEYSCSFMSDSQEISTEWYCVEDMVENAPTIIPTEEGET